MSASGVIRTNKDIDDGILLGHLFFYSLVDMKIDQVALNTLFSKNNLDSRFIRTISTADAFRRATSKCKQTVEISYNGKQTKAHIEVDELSSDKDGIIRLIGRKVLDEKNETLNYSVVGRIEYDRYYEQITVSHDSSYQYEYDYAGIVYDAKNRYQEWTQYHTKDTIRNLVTSIAKNLFPVNLTGTGLCKFISKKHKDTLYSLQGLIRDLDDYAETNGEANGFEIIPVIDTVEQRILIEQSASQEIKNELNTLTAELSGVLKAKSMIPVKTAQSYVNKFLELRDKKKTYEDLMNTYMCVVTAQIEQALSFVESNVEQELEATA